MIRFLYSDRLRTYPLLQDTMFRDRAAQFHHRLAWDVTLDDQGYERDDYDDLHPLYIIACQPDGTHVGSLRLLPTLGPTMVNDHFTHIIGGMPIISPLIWECTRFCVSSGAPRSTAAALMLAGGVAMQNCDIDQFIGVFDKTMRRVYRGIGAVPYILGQDDRLCVGLWNFDATVHDKLAIHANLSVAQAQNWFDRDMP
ncbi:MAG: acyl-homoserine-lactone synthase [Pseudomonadota bacterium]